MNSSDVLFVQPCDIFLESSKEVSVSGCRTLRRSLVLLSMLSVCLLKVILAKLEYCMELVECSKL